MESKCIYNLGCKLYGRIRLQTPNVDFRSIAFVVHKQLGRSVFRRSTMRGQKTVGRPSVAKSKVCEIVGYDFGIYKWGYNVKTKYPPANFTSSFVLSSRMFSIFRSLAIKQRVKLLIQLLI